MMPMVAATLVAASSTGIPAAISAPNASSISTSVTGRLIFSADDRSSATRSSMLSSMVMSPAWRISRPGCSSCTRSVTSTSGADVVVVLGELDRHEQRRPVRVPLRLRHRVDPVEARRVLRRISAAAASAACWSTAWSPRAVIRTFSVSARLEVGLVRPSRRRGRTRRGGSRRRSAPGWGSAIARPDRHEDEDEPGEDGAPRMRGAPAGGPQRDAGEWVPDDMAYLLGREDWCGLRVSSLTSAESARSGAPGPRPRVVPAPLSEARPIGEDGAMNTAERRPPGRLRLTSYAAWQLVLWVPSLLLLVFLVVGGVLAIVMVGMLFLLVAVPELPLDRQRAPADGRRRPRHADPRPVPPHASRAASAR